MARHEMKMYGNKVYGVKVSDYGIVNGYLDYATLAKIVGDCILNNFIRQETIDYYYWEIVNGDDYDGEIYQDYIISEYGYQFLSEHTDEIVFYNERLDIYIWGITHFGTSLDYVLTDIILIGEDEPNGK